MSYYIGGIPPPEKMDRVQVGAYYAGATSPYSPSQSAQLAAMGAARGQPTYHIAGSSPYPIPTGIPSVTLPFSSGGATAQYPGPRIGNPYAASVMQPGNQSAQMQAYPTHQAVGVSYSPVGTVPTVTSTHPMYSCSPAAFGRPGMPGAYMTSPTTAGQLPVSTHGYSPIAAHTLPTSSPLYAPGSSYGAPMPTSTMPRHPYANMSQMGYPVSGSPHAMPGAPTAYPGASLFGPHYT